MPVGHTHNIADQVNSRVTTSTKHANITCREDLCDVLANCYSPKPLVEFVDHVAAIKQLFNPQLSEQWTGSRVNRLHGIQSRDKEAGEKMMHLQITKDANGRIQISHKTKDDSSALWSEPFQIFKDTPTGFQTGNIRACVYKAKTTAEVVKKMESGVESCRLRITKDAYVSCMNDISLMRNKAKVSFHWKDQGRFLSEIQQQARTPEIQNNKHRPKYHNHHLRSWYPIAKLCK